MNVKFILILIATILWGLCALGVNPPRVNLGWLGLAVFGVSMLI